MRGQLVQPACQFGEQLAFDEGKGIVLVDLMGEEDGCKSLKVRDDLHALLFCQSIQGGNVLLQLLKAGLRPMQLQRVQFTF